MRCVRSDCRIVAWLSVVVLTVLFATGSAGAAPTEVSTCQPFGVSGQTYVLTDDVDYASANGDCFEITGSDIVIDGQGHTVNATVGSTGEGFFLNGQYGEATNVTIRNVTLEGWNTGIDLRAGAEATISNVIVDDVRTGVLVGTGDGSTATISDSTFTNTELYGIQVVQDSEATIRNVTIVSDDDDGMLLAGTVTVEDSTVTITDPLGSGIVINDVSGYQSPFDVTLRNNTIQAGYRAISVSDGVNATIVDNTLVGDGDADGVFLDYSTYGSDGPVNALVEGNDISEIDDGVVVAVDNRTESLADVTIARNDIRNATRGIMLNEDEDSEFQTWVRDAALTYDVSDNTIGNVTRGVYVVGTSGSIDGNQVAVNDESLATGLVVAKSTATLTGNDVTGTGTSGRGVSLWNGANVTIDGDRYHDGRQGLFTYNATVVLRNVAVENVSTNGFFVRNSTVTIEGGTVANAPTAFESGILSDEWADVTVTGVAVTEVEQAAEFEYGNLTLIDTPVTVAGNTTLETFDVEDTDLTLDGVTVERADEYPLSTAVYGWGGSNVTVTDSVIDDADSGVLAVDSNVTVVGTTISNASDHAIRAINASVAIEGNEIVNGSRNDIRTHDGAIDLTNATGTVADNTIDSNWDGINAHESNVTVSANNITAVLYSVNFRDSAGTIANNTADDGMYIRSSYADDPREVLVVGNVIHKDGFGSGISLAWNVRATVYNNTITANHHGVRTFLVRGADITGNTIHIDSTSYDEHAGVFFEESTTSPDLAEAEDITVVANEFIGATGVRLGDQYGQEINPYREYVIVANDFSATETPVYNLNETAFSVPLNYYGPRGPVDHEFVGPVDDVEPFLTKPLGELGQVALPDVQTFGYALEFEPGLAYAFGTPATLENTLHETLGDFEGAVYLYDESSQSWQLATGDETLQAMDAVVVVPTTEARAVVDFADATPSYPMDREVVTGWNFVAPRHYDDAESAFSTQTVALTDALDLYWQPENQPMYSSPTFGHYQFAADTGGGIEYGYETGPRVSPFGGYFVYATESGTIPGVVPDGVTIARIEALLDADGDV